MSNLSLQTQLERLASDRWARRGVRILLRASGLALSVACLALGLQLLLGWSLMWTWVSTLTLICVAVGALLVLRPRMSSHEVARRLDRRFQLHDQLATALEVDPASEGVAAYLNEQSRRTMNQIRRRVMAHRAFPWAELGLVVALALLLGGLLIMAGVGSTLPQSGAEPLPGLVTPPVRSPADEAAPPEPQPPEADEPQENQASQNELANAAALEALANALRDQGLTRPAADSIDQGNPDQAAQQLRDLATQASGLTSQTRAELAQDLRAAADQLAPTNPEVAEQLRESADALAPGSSTPEAGFEQLADTVEQLGQGQGNQGETNGEDENAAAGAGGGAGQTAQPGAQRERSSDRLGVDGVPLELDGAGQGNQPAQGSGNEAATEAGTANPRGGFERGGQSSQRVEIGDDPLRIPADLRDVVQDYFSP
ncbi:hypothetical protein [Candidatus Chloroploca sp. Khr17]|uniref:hypothetical protein n=1 Tax=Candidatus Chloroploca sp. Khr17 TaxID=2496869 RepID=UPI00101D649A|nr:hypothetical protein [Candidatus Chloroploca sp. Khr17]